MGRPRKRPLPAGAAGKDPMPNVEIGDVTNQVYPDGVPKAPDGSVLPETMITSDDAKRIGALTPDSARYNKDNARRAARRLNGEKDVRWGDQEAMQLFLNVRNVFDPSTIFLYITRKNPQPEEDYRPIAMMAVKTPQGMYDHIAREIHKEREATEYMIRFRDQGAERARGYLRLPNTMVDRSEPPAPAQAPAAPSPPPGYPQGYGGMPPYGGYPYGYPPPVMQQQAAPAPAQYSQEPPVVHVHQPVAPQAPAPSVPPGWEMWMTHQQQLVDRLFGELAAARQEMARYASAPPGQAPVAAPVPSAPSPPVPAPGPIPTAPLPYVPYAANPLPLPVQQPAPVTAAPAPAQPAPLNLTEQVKQAAGVLETVANQVDGFRQRFSPSVAATPVSGPIPEVELPEPHAPPRYQSTTLGVGDMAPVIVSETDGDVHIGNTLIANLPKVPGWIEMLLKLLKTARADGAPVRPSLPQATEAPTITVSPVHAPAPAPAPVAAPSGGFVPSFASLRPN